MLTLPLAIALSASLAIENQKLSVPLGQEKVVTYPGLTRIAVADPNVADVHVQGSGEVLILGKAHGWSTLTVWQGEKHFSVDIEVTDSAGVDLEKQLHSLPGMESVRVEKYNDKLVLQGRVDSDDDLDKIKKLISTEPTAVNLVTVERAAHEQVVERINVALQRAGIKNAHANQVGDRIFLEGQVEDEADVRRAQLIADTIAGNPVGPSPQP